MEQERPRFTGMLEEDSLEGGGLEEGSFASKEESGRRLSQGGSLEEGSLEEGGRRNEDG